MSIVLQVPGRACDWTQRPRTACAYEPLFVCFVFPVVSLSPSAIDLNDFWRLSVILVLDRHRAHFLVSWHAKSTALSQAALINAAQDANASRAQVRLTVEDDQVHIMVADAGRGLPFRRHYSIADSFVMQEGTESIKQRVAGLQRQLLFDSTQSGARIEIVLPVGPGSPRGTADLGDADEQRSIEPV
jgi:hypothetical protein